MGAQPTTLMTGLVAATKSTDTAGPTVADHHARGRARRRPTATRSPSPAPPPTPAAGWPASRCPPTAAPPGTPADRHHVVDATPSSSTGVGSSAVQVRAIDDSANIGTVRDRSRSTVSCPLQHLRRRRAGHPGRRRRRRRSSSACGSPRRRRLRHRRPVLQGHRQHRHPRRLPVEHDRAAAGPGHLHQRDRHRLADRHLRHAGRRRPPARPTSSPTPRRDGHYAAEPWAFAYRGAATPARCRSPAASAPTRPGSTATPGRCPARATRTPTTSSTSTLHDRPTPRR